MRSDSWPATENLERQEALGLSRPACTPASLAGWFAPPRLEASRSGRARARGSSARWRGWPASADAREVARHVGRNTL